MQAQKDRHKKSRVSAFVDGAKQVRSHLGQTAASQLQVANQALRSIDVQLLADAPVKFLQRNNSGDAVGVAIEHQCERFQVLHYVCLGQISTKHRGALPAGRVHSGC